MLEEVFPIPSLLKKTMFSSLFLSYKYFNAWTTVIRPWDANKSLNCYCLLNERAGSATATNLHNNYCCYYYTISFRAQFLLTMRYCQLQLQNSISVKWSLLISS